MRKYAGFILLFVSCAFVLALAGSSLAVTAPWMVASVSVSAPPLSMLTAPLTVPPSTQVAVVTVRAPLWVPVIVCVQDAARLGTTVFDGALGGLVPAVLAAMNRGILPSIEAGSGSRPFGRRRISTGLEWPAFPIFRGP